MQVNRFDVSSAEFYPFAEVENSFCDSSLVEIESRAEAFVNDDTQCIGLKSYDLIPEEITLLWLRRRPLAERVIGAAHKIFLGFRTYEFPIYDKLNTSGPTWSTYKAIVLLGANQTAGEDQHIPAQELLVYASLVKFTPPLSLETIQNYVMNGMANQSEYSTYLYGVRINSKETLALVNKAEERDMKAKLWKLSQAKFPLALYQRALWHLKNGDNNKCYSNLKKAADRGLATAQFKLSENFLFGESVFKQDIDLSLMYLNYSVNQGYMPAVNNQGYYNFHGIGAPANLTEAFRLFSIAASRGNASAQLNLAYCLTYGYGCEMNPEEAEECLEMAKNRTGGLVGLLVADMPPGEKVSSNKSIKKLQKIGQINKSN